MRSPVTIAVANAKGGCGKCLAADSVIVDPVSGRPYTLEEVIGDPDLGQVFTFDGATTRVAPIAAKIDSGIQPTLRVTFASGRSITATPWHPFLMPDGWRRADELTAGETAALPARLPGPQQPERLPEAELELLAALLAEGGTSGAGTRLSTTDPDMLALVRRAAEPLGIGVRAVPGSSCDYYLSGGDQLPVVSGLCGCGCGEATQPHPVSRRALGQERGAPKRYFQGHRHPDTTLKALRRRHGLHRTLAREKRMPDAVYRLPDDQLGRFLAIFWMCDGYVGKYGGPGITLASRDLVVAIQHLLLRLGIQSAVHVTTKRHKGQTFTAWRLGVFAQYWSRFLDAVPLWGAKRERLVGMLAIEGADNHNVGEPSCPPALRDALYALSPGGIRRPDGQPRLGDVAQLLGWGRFQFDNLFNGDRLSRRNLAAFLRVFGGEERHGWLASPDIFWDTIVAIEDGGEQQVYDLTVDETHCFVADDVIVHNTTTALHLAVAFAERGLDVLAVDVDPQGTLTRQLGVAVRGQPSVKEVLLDGLPLADAVVTARPRLAVLGADLRLASADLDLATAVGGDTRLRRALRNAPYDLILIDCPPAIGKLTVNALVAATAFVVPLEPSQYSLEGLDMLQPTVRAVRENYSSDLDFLGPALVMAEPRTTVTRVVREQLEQDWGERFFRTVIRKSQRTREVAFTRDTLFDGGEETTTGNDYLALATEIGARLGLPLGAATAGSRA